METHKLELEAGFEDWRGKILPIVHDLANVQMIYSRGGAVRANHYHKTDTHTCYIVQGSLYYYWRNHGETTIHKEKIISGELFKTGPLIDHEMVFIENTIMVVVSEHKRDAVTYDEDIVKIDPLHEQYENV
jgi:dTDP-4-dehydrorhamnose 3,5-epimerase-like enzyme